MFSDMSIDYFLQMPLYYVSGLRGKYSTTSLRTRLKVIQEIFDIYRL